MSAFVNGIGLVLVLIVVSCRQNVVEVHLQKQAVVVKPVVPVAVPVPPKVQDSNTLQLLGIVSSGKEKIALLKDSSGKEYALRVGERVGHGPKFVDAIAENQVTIREEQKDAMGKVLTTKVVLQLSH